MPCTERLLRAALILLSAIAAGISPLASASADAKVFAHYMVCCPAAGPGANQGDFESEIRLAMSYGIDGFALNAGGWDKSEPIYKKRVVNLYRAADAVGNFKLFISLDGNAFREIPDIISTVTTFESQFKVDGKPFFSSFSGEGHDGKKGEELIDFFRKSNIFFVPYYYSRPYPSELPNGLLMDLLIGRYTGIDGFFYYGAAGSGERLAKVNAQYAEKWHAAGKKFMASVTPFYLGWGGNFRIFETHGFEGMAAMWTAAIQSKADWVQIVTWNDWYESSYVAPFDLSRKAPNNALPNNTLLPHTAYLDASRYFIEWFKNGVAPKLTDDKIYIFYRPLLKDEIIAVNLMDSSKKSHPAGFEDLQDNLYLTAMARAPAKLRVQLPGRNVVLDLKEGPNNFSFPIARGDLSVRLQRPGEPMRSGRAKIESSLSIPTARLNYLAEAIQLQ